MAKKVDISTTHKRTSKVGEEMNQKDRKREKTEESERHQPKTFPLSDIQNRIGGDTRDLSLDHIVSLAESVGALGLLEPIVIDKGGYLLAGGHRLAACRLLEKAPKKRVDFLRSCNEEESVSRGLEERVNGLELSIPKKELQNILVRVMDFDASSDSERALAIEAAENTQRKDYTAKEVFALYDRLLQAGYTDKRGKPKEGEKAARPAIAFVIGKSIKTVQRMLLKMQKSEQEPSKVDDVKQAMKNFSKALDKLTAACEELEGYDSMAKLIEILSAPKVKKLIEKSKNELHNPS